MSNNNFISAKEMGKMIHNNIIKGIKSGRPDSIDQGEELNEEETRAYVAVVESLSRQMFCGPPAIKEKETL